MKPKKYFRGYVYNAISLQAAAALISGIRLESGVNSLLLASLSITLVDWLVKPLLKLLLLPINLITLVAFRWLINVLALYLAVSLVPHFQLIAFDFSGWQYQGFIIPPLHLSLFWVYIVVSFSLSLTTSFLHWLCRS